MPNPCVRWPTKAGARRRLGLGISGLAAALSLALGCSDGKHRLGSRPEGMERIDDGRTLLVDLCKNDVDLELIDDMEDGTFGFRTRGRYGTWFAFNDETEGAEQTPGPLDDVYELETLDPPRDGHSNVATRTRGSGFEIWGGGIGFDLNQREVYDASAYAGIAFFARDATGTSPALRVEILDAYSFPGAGECDRNVPNDCYDNFGEDVVLSEDWQVFYLEWSDLERNHNSGKPLPHPIEPSAIYGLRFQTSSLTASEPTIDFDFTIDDVAFLCHPIDP